MNHKLIISRFALSTALLMSAVAGPAISNAAEPAAPAPLQTLHKLSDTVLNVDGISIISSFTNPVDLAKKYAPDTVEEWTKTLADYEKTIGAHVNTLYSVIESVPVDSAESTTLPASSEKGEKASATLTVTSSAIAADSIAKIVGEPSSVTVVPAKEISMEKIDMSAAPDTTNDSDMSFIQAEIALAKAVQAENADAIKQSLTKLLEAYKQQIAEWEAAK